MKTNEVKACMTQQLRRLQVLPEPQRRAELAELREDVRADTVEHFGNLGPVVAVTDEHLSAARRLAGRGARSGRERHQADHGV